MSYALLRALLLEQDRRVAARRGVPTTAWLTSQQRKVHDSEARTVALLAGRAGGKSSAAVGKAISVVQDVCRPWILLSSLTREQARRTLYQPLQSLSESVGLKLPAPDHQGRIRLPDGGIIYLAGVDTLRDIRRYRGTPWDFAFVDEAGEIPDNYLYELIYNVIEPRLMDKPHSKLWVGGTPGFVLNGTWFDICGPKEEGGSNQPGWEVFSWDARANPHVAAESYFSEILRSRGWDEEHPTFQREYLGRWVQDTTRTVASVSENQFVDSVPEAEYTKILSLDFGVVDDCAGVHLWLPPGPNPLVYVVSEWSRAGLSPSEASEIIQKDVLRHEVDRVIGDSGGIGRAFISEYARRHQLPIQPAPKHDKAIHLRLFADDMSRFRFLRGTEPLVREIKTIRWNEKRTDVAEGSQDHRFHATYYGYRALLSNLQKAKAELIKKESTDFISVLDQMHRKQKQAGPRKRDWHED